MNWSERKHMGNWNVWVLLPFLVGCVVGFTLTWVTKTVLVVVVGLIIAGFVLTTLFNQKRS
jgi:hypothetical protein